MSSCCPYFTPLPVPCSPVLAAVLLVENLELAAWLHAKDGCWDFLVDPCAMSCCPQRCPPLNNSISFLGASGPKHRPSVSVWKLHSGEQAVHAGRSQREREEKEPGENTFTCPSNPQVHRGIRGQ